MIPVIGDIASAPFDSQWNTVVSTVLDTIPKTLELSHQATLRFQSILSRTMERRSFAWATRPRVSRLIMKVLSSRQSSNKAKISELGR